MVGVYQPHTQTLPSQMTLVPTTITHMHAHSIIILIIAEPFQVTAVVLMIVFSFQ